MSWREEGTVNGSRANIAFLTSCLKDVAQRPIGRFETDERKKLLWGSWWNPAVADILFVSFLGMNMYRPESKHWCVFHTHSIVGLHCLNTPPALVLFVDSIKQMVRKPITQGGMKWNAMCMCVDIMCVCCVRGPSLALQVSLGFLVTLCLGGESAGDNWTLPGTFNKCIERRNRKTC